MPIRRVFEYRSERDQDLLNAYRRQIALTSGLIRLREVMCRVVNSPSSRFWVSPERAMRVISSMEQGNRLEGMMRNKRIMFREIYRRVHLLRERPPYRQLPLVEVVQMVVEQPAPSFYMTPQSAIVIMHHIRKRRKQCNSSESHS